MKKLIAPYLYVGIYLIVFFFISLSASAQSSDGRFVDGKLYVKLKDSAPVQFSSRDYKSVEISEVAVIRDLSTRYKVVGLSRPFSLNNDAKLARTLLVEVDEKENIDEIIRQIAADTTVEYVERVPLDKISYVPNDSLYNLYNGPQNWNWHLEVIQAEKAWDITKGSPDIKVAIIDNAVWVDHPDLKGKVVAQRDVYYSRASANPPDTGNRYDWSHGTHVAGLIGAISDNLEGISSIGFNVSLIAVRASSNSNSSSISAAYPGIQWAAENGADIINMSWGSGERSQTNQNVINSIHDMGIVMIAAAGNEDSAGVHYPSGYDNVISVASTDWNDIKSEFSNYSNTVDVSSPGGEATPGPAGLLSTTLGPGRFGDYDTYQGTSMASPVVAGIAGLILSINNELTPDEVTDILKSTSDNISAMNPDFDGMLGLGRVNAYKAVLATPFEPTAKFNTSVNVLVPGSEVDFIDLSTGVPSEWEWTFEGATPSTSQEINPTDITYNTAGTYDVTLTVTNRFGTSSITYFDYIEVVTDPLPFIFMSVSDSLPCIGDPVALQDSSLYGPTAWEWTIVPNTHTFVNGTTSTSSNPVVEFARQGDYNVTLTVWNSNGMNSEVFSNVIHVQGIVPPYSVDMEDDSSGYFVLGDSTKSQSNIDLRAAHDSQGGIHFHGDPVPVNWSGTATGGTAQQAWESNRTAQSEAYLCGVNAMNFEDLMLSFDLRQTYSLGPRYCWFRVLVNGVPVADSEGNTNFNPVTAKDDPWKRLQFDLTPYVGTLFDITLQASTRFSDKVQGEGDNVFIDNIEISSSVSARPVELSADDLRVYPNPTRGTASIMIKGIAENSLLEILDTRGKIVYSKRLETLSGSQSIEVPAFAAGLYLVRLSNASKQRTVKLIVTE